MIKSLIITMFMVAGLFYVMAKYDLTSTFENSEKFEKIHQYDKYYLRDSIGEDVLDVRGESDEVQIQAWNKSPFKNAFFTLFPNFSDMKYFIETHLRGDFLSNHLLEKVEKIKSDFFSGKITTEEAKREFRMWQYQ